MKKWAVTALAIAILASGGAYYWRQSSQPATACIVFGNTQMAKRLADLLTQSPHLPHRVPI